MATPATPGTPTSESPAPTGTWRHPRLDEITRRQQATTFDERNLRAIVANLVFLVLAFVLPAYLPSWLLPARKTLTSISPYLPQALSLLRFLPLFNISRALLPLIRSPDDLSDIPLTPSQRSLLGLNPHTSSKSPTPGSTYITPPRYARSTTPRSSLSAAGARTASPTFGASASASSPASASPLLQRTISRAAAVADQHQQQRRLSFGSSTGSFSSSTANLLLDNSLSSVITTPQTPTPAGPGAAAGSYGPFGKSASVSLNNKWLYERGRMSPVGANRGVFS